jgi:ATP-binding cassette, subfamily C, bacterial LapB
MQGDLQVADKPPRFAEWLVAPMRDNKATYLKVGLAAVMINLFALVTSLFTMTVYNRVIPNNAMTSLVALSIGFCILLIFDFVLKMLRAYFIDLAGADVDEKVGEEVYQRLLSVRLDQRRGSTGGLASLMRELETLREFFASATLAAIVDVPFIIVTLTVIALIGGWLVLVPIAAIPLTVVAGALTQPIMDRLSTKTLGQAMAKQSVLVETIGGLETIKSVDASRMMSKRWSTAVEAHSRSSLTQRLISNISMTVAGTVQQLAYAGMVIAGVGLIATQSLTMGGLIACSMLSSRALAPLAQIANLLSRLTATRTSYRQLRGFMQTPVELTGEQAMNPNVLSGKISFKEVVFSYPEATEKALNGTSFDVAPGDKIAILGRVGSGKSTIARMLLGLYPPQEGLILLDGSDVRQIAPSAIRKQIGAALQESVLMSGSIRENICLERPGVDEEEMIRVATMTGAHEFIGRIANGYDLRLSDRGESLSGGQRQAIALARALVGRPPILVLDEPTSAMDNQSEMALLQRLEAEVADRTLIVITHRLPLLRLVNRVILIDGGKVIADGPRDAVLKSLQGNNRQAA